MTTTPPLWRHGEAISFSRPRRAVDTVFLHCSASDRARDDDVSVMRRWHLARGWSDVGYHFFIRKNGDIQAGRDLQRMPAAQGGHNRGTIAICSHGLEDRNFTRQQYESVIALCQTIGAAYAPTITRFRGHREVSRKACPVYDYRRVLGLDSAGHMTGPTTATPLANARPDDAGAGATRPATGTLGLLDRGPAVKVLQDLLNINGWSLQPDGIYGRYTFAAVQAFQGLVRVDPTGAADPRTRIAVASGLPRVRKLEQGIRGPDVNALQRLLNLHCAGLTPDGIFGTKTRGAVVAFQRNKGRPSTGVADAATRLAFW